MRIVRGSTLVVSLVLGSSCDAPEDFAPVEEASEVEAHAPDRAPVDRTDAVLHGRLDPGLSAVGTSELRRVLVVYDAPELAATGAASLRTRESLVSSDRQGTQKWVRSVPGLTFEHAFATEAVVVATVDGEALDDLLANPAIARVEEDIVLETQLSQAMALIDVPEARSTYGVDGEGIRVAVFDTGVDADHADLSGALLDEVCFCSGGCCPDGSDEQTGSGAAVDDNGHGSHVSGIIVGAGGVAPTGAAPGASLIAAKVQAANGSGSYSNLLLGLEWLALNQPETDIVNMSIGAFSTDCFAGNAANTLTSTYAQALRDQGTVLFAAAGNDAASNGISLPACVDEVISVGAVYDANFGSSILNYPACSDTTPSQDQITCFSNVDTNLDLLAPGARIDSTDENGGTASRSGTSQASPAAAGCAVLLREHDAELTPDQVADVLRDTGIDILDARVGMSFPRVDCDGALAAADSDGDGTPTASDGCPFDPDKTSAGACGCGVADTNSDSDATPDCSDGCPLDGEKIEPGLCGCGVADTNSDSDATPDCNDECPLDGEKTEPGLCGCGVADTNSDSDATPDCNDDCPLDGEKIEPGACGCGTPDTNSDSDATPDCSDGCPLDGEKIEPGLCGCGVADTNSDSDATPDCNDGCPLDDEKTEPGLCGCGVADTNSDSDATPDCNDGCPLDGEKTEPGACGCGTPDTNSDSDSTPDCNDGCPLDGEETEPGACGCGVSEVDTDDDGTPDCTDACPGDPDKTAEGACGCGVSDIDADDDDVPTCVDACPGDPGKDAPGTCGCGVADADTDEDGTLDCEDPCPLVADTEDCAADADGDGTSDALDDDIDDDGVDNDVDNCVFVPNIDQANADDDAMGDACDVCPGDGSNDADGDGVCDPIDNCPSLANADLADGDGDGVGDACECDEGVCDSSDNCPSEDNPEQDNADDDPVGDACDPCPDDPENDVDGDGVCDDIDNCPAAANPEQSDVDGDGRGDLCDVQDPSGTSSSSTGSGEGDSSGSSTSTNTRPSGTTLGTTSTGPGSGDGGTQPVDPDIGEAGDGGTVADPPESSGEPSSEASGGGCRAGPEAPAEALLFVLLLGARRRRSAKRRADASGVATAHHVAS